MIPKFKIAANTLVQILGRLITSGVTFLVTILVARQFGVEGYGEFTKIMAYTAYFYLVADFGFNAVVLKKIEDQKEHLEKYFTNLLGLRIAASFVLIFLALTLLNFLPYDSFSTLGFSSLAKLGIVVASLTILTQAIFSTANLLFQRNLRYDFSVLASSLGSGLILVLTFLFTSLGAPLLTIIFSYVAGGILMAASALYFNRQFLPRTALAVRGLPHIYLSFDFSLWGKIILSTLPLGLTLVFNLVYFHIDMMILALSRPNFEVGIYGLAYKFFEFPLAVATFFMNSSYPVMLSHYHQKTGKLKNLIKSLAIFLFFSSLALAFLAWFLAPLLTIIKQEFASSILPLRILSLSLPVFFLSALFMWVLITLGKQKILALIYGASMVLNIALNLIFIPRHGYLAASVITGVTELWVLFFSGMGIFFFLRGSPSLSKK